MTIEESIELAAARAVDRRLAAIQQALARIEASISPKLLTVAEAAEALGCCKATVRKMIREGRLEPKRIGRCVRIDPREILRTAEE